MTLPHQKRSTNSRHPATLQLLLLLLTLLSPCCLGTRHIFVTRGDSRTVIAPIGAPFGFWIGGFYNLTVFDFQLQNAEGTVEAGFILKRFDSESDFAKYEQGLDAGVCSFQEYLEEEEEGALFGDDEYDDEFGKDDFQNIGLDQSASDEGIFLHMRNHTPATPSISHEFDADEEGLYFLIYQVCHDVNHTVKRVKSTFELDWVYKNYDKLGYTSYLTAGEMPLPLVFLYFTISYSVCLLIWAKNIRTIQSSRNNTAKVYPIHHLMTVLLALKTCSILFESIRYHYIRISGHAELWTVVYYTLAFIKGTFLFTVILLIGSGWSFVKPFLNEKEKKVVFVVLVLQVIDNIAVVVLSHETEGESWYDDWSAVLHLVDILCCCAVLVPIVWQVNAMEKALGVDDETRDEEEEDPLSRDREENESVRALSKLRLFRSFYLLVVGYIYFTRIIVYLFSTTLGYRHTWIRYAVTELGTLLFYVITGLLFKPMEDNPYLALKKDESVDKNEASLEMGKLEMNLKD